MTGTVCELHIVGNGRLSGHRHVGKRCARSSIVGLITSDATPVSQRQSKNPLWFIAPFVVSIVVLLFGHPGWALVLYAVALAAAAVTHPDLPSKRTADGSGRDYRCANRGGAVGFGLAGVTGERSKTIVTGPARYPVVSQTAMPPTSRRSRVTPATAAAPYAQ